MSPAERPAVRTVVLEADAVSKRYGARQALNTAWVRARAGVITGLLGGNGAGKSTLLRCLIGEIAPDNGSIRFDGIAHGRVRLAFLARRGVFFLPDRDLLYPGVAIGRQLSWMARTFGTADRLAEITTRLGIAHVLASPARALSGGERRRSEVAMALLRAPRVFILDEPLRGIAPPDAEVILGELRRFAGDGGAVLVTGHELPLLLPALDEVTWCHMGRTRDFGSVAAALEDHAFRRYFLPWGPARR